jgi:hypothetical protein
MRGWFTFFFLGTIGLAATGLACGSDAEGGFECSQKSIENGSTTVCGRFGTTTETSYTCAPPGTLTIRTFTPDSSGLDCPHGTVPITPDPDLGGSAPEGSDSPGTPGGPSSGPKGDDAPGKNGSPGGPPASGPSGGPSGGPTGSPPKSDDHGGSTPPPPGSYSCSGDGTTTTCVQTSCDAGFELKNGTCVPTKPKGNNGVGNGVDPQPPGNPPVNDGPGTSPGHPGNRHHAK